MGGGGLKVSVAPVKGGLLSSVHYDNDILRSYVRFFIHLSKGKEVRKLSFSHHNFFQKIKLVHEKKL